MTNIKDTLCVTFTALAMFVLGPWATNNFQPVEINLLTPTTRPEATVSVSREQQDAQDWVYFQDCVAAHKCRETSATYYAQDYHGNRMANGEMFSMYDATTCAANDYPLGTWLRVWGPEVKYLERGETEYHNHVDVQVRDRGLMGRAIDLSYGAFEVIAPHSRGTVKVWVEVLP